jgi:pilus assembly protein CpaC
MKRLVRSTLAVLSLLSVPSLAEEPKKPAPAAAAAGELITVRAGTSKTLTVPNLTRIALGEPEIADVKVLGDNAIRIDGLKAGQTALILWTGNTRKPYRIVVEK